MFLYLYTLAASLDETELSNAIMSLFKNFIIFQFYYQIILVHRSMGRTIGWFCVLFLYSWLSLVWAHHCGFSVFFPLLEIVSFVAAKKAIFYNEIDRFILICV